MLLTDTNICVGFPGSSARKESTCDAGDPSSIPGLGMSSEEGIGYALQYSWASLVAQQVKNPPAMQETWLWSLGWEDPLEKGKATYSNILARRIPWMVYSMESQRGVAKNRTRLSDFHFQWKRWQKWSKDNKLYCPHNAWLHW